jgi:outer membrane protein OmpA-like peptidoglycan-associated protein
MLSYILLLLPSTALAADGYSADIELVHHGFSDRSQFGVDNPRMDDPGTWRLGLFSMYEKDPLILYEFGNEIGPIVTNRQHFGVGFAYDVNSRLGVRAVLPGAFSFGSEIPELSGDGAAVGDLGVGGRVVVFENNAFALAIKGDLSVPTGTKLAWIGEDGVRFTGGLLAEYAYGPFAISGDLGLTGRGALETPEDYTLGSELAAGAGLRYDLRPGRTALVVDFISRNGFTNFFKGGAENPSEIMGGIIVRPSDSIRVDLGAGSGISDGYGTTAYRVLAGITYIHKTPEPVIPPAPVVVVKPKPPPAVNIEQILEVKEEQAWKEGELARIVDAQIVIREPIQFEFNTAKILPESIPTLEFVSKLMNENAQIGYVTVEGHASEEGSYEYNYDLAERRSRAVWQELILARVHPDRVAYRGMGEVQPKSSGIEESELAINRRVEFHIVRQFSAMDDLPTYETKIRLPWNGESYTVKQPDYNPEFGKSEEDLRKELELKTYDPTQFRLKEDEKAPEDTKEGK